MFRSLLRWARVTKPGDDTGDFPVQQVGYLGKVGDAVVWFPYGFHANVPADELALLLSMQGNPEARVQLPGSPKKRVKPLAASEVVIFHPNSGSKIHFKANGDVEVDSTAAIDVTAVGDVCVTTPGDVKVDAAELQVNADMAHDGTLLGFHGATPVDQADAYTMNNPNELRTLNISLADVDTIRRVLGTLVIDLQEKGLVG